jgi:hypothetical protein
VLQFAFLFTTFYIDLCILCALAVQLHFSLHFRRVTPSHPLQRHHNDDAADIREQFAANAPIQRHHPNQPPRKNVNSAVSLVLPACHFSGFFAQFAFFAEFAESKTPLLRTTFYLWHFCG